MSKLLTIPEAAERLGRGRHFVYGLIRTGQIKPSYLPSARGKQMAARIDERVLDAFIDSCAKAQRRRPAA